MAFKFYEEEPRFEWEPGKDGKVKISYRQKVHVAQSSGARDRDVWVNTRTGETFEVTTTPGSGWSWPPEKPAA